jgi:hypothetical protein
MIEEWCCMKGKGRKSPLREAEPSGYGQSEFRLAGRDFEENRNIREFGKEASVAFP